MVERYLRQSVSIARGAAEAVIADKSRPNRVSEGEEVIITRHEKLVARLVPEGAQRSDDVRRAVAGLRELQQRIRRRSKAKLSNREVRSAIDEGRL